MIERREHMAIDPGKTYLLLENIVVLKKSPLFSAVNTSDLRTVASIIDELAFRKGEFIVRENDVGDSLYLIKSGKVTILKKTGQNADVELAVLNEGECFGEMAVVDEEVRSASVCARENCTLLRLNREDLNDVIMNSPSIGVELLKIFVKRLRIANARIEALSHTGNEPGIPDR